MRILDGDASRIGAVVAAMVACASAPACGRVANPSSAGVAGATAPDSSVQSVFDAAVDAPLEAAPRDAGAESASDAGDAGDSGDLCASFFQHIPYAPALVCFGSDATPYATYLRQDAGVGVGGCPSPGDFVSSCVYFSVCGPLPASAVPSDAQASACCYWVSDPCAVPP